MQIYVIMLHDLIHYIYKPCIACAVHGAKHTMRRSKMEMEVDILKILAQKGPLKLTHIMYKTNVNCNVLNTKLEFLIGQGLIEVRKVGRGSHVYLITGSGLTLLKSWKEVKQLLQMVEKENEAQPHFRNTVSVRA